MALTNGNLVGPAMKSGRFAYINKASISSQVSGGFSSLWRGTGIPAQGAIPGAAAICTDATTGAVPLPAKAGGEDRCLALMHAQCGTAGHSMMVCDRLGAMGGLSGTVTTAQTVNLDVSGAGSNLPARINSASYKSVRWFLEWYTATGGTGVNATCAVTYSDNSTGNIVVAVPATTGASRMLEIVPTNGLGIKSVQTVTLSATTGTAGSFGVTALVDIAEAISVVASRVEVKDWAALGLPDVPDSACMTAYVLCTSTSTGAILIKTKFAVG